MNQAASHRSVMGYVRLSQEERSRRGAFEEKIERHISLLQELARQNGDTLAVESILIEVKSGEKLVTRPRMCEILQAARTGLIHRLYCMAPDRLTRSLVDQETIAQAFFAGEVELITCKGTTRFDAHLDTTPWELEALLAQRERVQYSFRRRHHNKIRTREGQRSGGFAPYGYRWVKPRYSDDNQTLLEAGHYVTHPEEYPVVEEIFRRIPVESLMGLVRDLNARWLATGYPAPPSARFAREDTTPRWYHSTLHSILHNPFYAGYPAHRYEKQRGKGRVLLSEAEWVRPRAPLDYPRPLADWEAFEELQAILMMRRSGPTPSGKSRSLLTGILYCSRGRPACCKRKAYRCHCSQSDPHPGNTIQTEAVEALALRCLKEAICALPEDAIPTAPPVNRAELQRQYTKALRVLRKAEMDTKEITRAYTIIVRRFGEEEYDRQAGEIAGELKAAREEVDRLERDIANADYTEQLTLLGAVRNAGEGDLGRGLDRLWAEATPGERHAWMGLVIERIDMLSSEKRYQRHRAVRVTPTPFFLPFYSGGEKEL